MSRKATFRPARRALAAAGYLRLEQFTKVSEAALLRLHGMGPKALDQIRRALEANGQSFADGNAREGRTRTTTTSSRELQMISDPKVDVRAAQPYVAIPIKVTFKEWGQANALVGEVFAWLGKKGIECAGQPPFFRYWVIGDMNTKFELEVGVPVENAVPGDGRVIAGSIPGGTYATLVHTGHPDRLVHSLTALQDWATSQGLEWNNRWEGAAEVWGGRFEFYLTDPAEQPDLEQWSIEIAYQVRDDTAR